MTMKNNRMINTVHRDTEMTFKELETGKRSSIEGKHSKVNVGFGSLSNRHKKNKNRPWLEETAEIEWESSGKELAETNSSLTVRPQKMEDMDFLIQTDSGPSISPINSPTSRSKTKPLKLVSLDYNFNRKKATRIPGVDLCHELSKQISHSTTFSIDGSQRIYDGERRMMEINRTTAEIPMTNSKLTSESPNISPTSSPIASDRFSRRICNSEPKMLERDRTVVEIVNSSLQSQNQNPRKCASTFKRGLFQEDPFHSISTSQNISPKCKDRHFVNGSDISPCPSPIKNTHDQNHNFLDFESPCEVTREDSQSFLFFANSQETILCCTSPKPTTQPLRADNEDSESIVLTSDSSCTISQAQSCVEESSVKNQIEISPCSSPLISSNSNIPPETFSPSSSWWKKVASETEGQTRQPTDAAEVQPVRQTIESTVSCGSVNKRKRHKLGGLALRLERLERREESFNNLHRFKLGPRKEVPILLKITKIRDPLSAIPCGYCEEESSSKKFILIIPKSRVAQLCLGCIVAVPNSCPQWKISDTTTLLFPAERDLEVKECPPFGPTNVPRVLYQWPASDKNQDCDK